MTEFLIAPVAKPRMTRSDVWKKRPCVMKYWSFKDRLVIAAKAQGFVLGDRYGVVFYIEMPGSWSEKKRKLYDGKPHQQKPDLDNLIKSVNDCLKSEDASVHDIEASKIWWKEGKIIFYDLRRY